MKDDTISRAAAIETVRKAQSIGQAHRMLVQLPSAQPIGTNTVQVEDCISRAAVVDAIEGVDWYHQNDNGEMVHGANSAEDQPWYKAEDIYAAIEGVPPAQPVEDARAMCGECDAWNKYKNYPQPEQFNPCTVCQEFDCTGCKFRRT